MMKIMFLYVPEFLCPEDRRSVHDDLSRIVFSEQKRIPVKPKTVTHRVFTSPQVTEWLGRIFGPVRPGAQHIPIEYRDGSLGMKWHVDTPLIGRQIECVYTVENTSDSVTLYKDFFGRTHRQWTEPGSLVVVRAGGVRHSVTAATTGQRTIVKFVFLVDP
jgi:hypothetical protein